MTDLFLRRTFEPPLSVADVLDMAREGRWCMELYSVDWRGSFLAADGRTMVCWFVGRDAESVRMALRQAGAQLQELWIGTVHDAPEPAQPNVLVERSFDRPVTVEEIQAIEDAGQWCLQEHHVKFARTFFSQDRVRMFCLYAAPDAESVRLAQRQAGMPVDSVWSFQPVGPHLLRPNP